jgi:hypothetical protein
MEGSSEPRRREAAQEPVLWRGGNAALITGTPGGVRNIAIATSCQNSTDIVLNLA